MANISMNPMQTTNARGLFGVQSDGMIQGVAFDDPANRYNLASGYVAKDVRLPIWGGVAIAEYLPGNKSAPRGSKIRRAVSPLYITGFSVFNQAHNGITSPSSPVPQYGPNMSVSFYRFGSNMRVPVKCSDGVVALATAEDYIEQGLAWDFANQEVAVAEDLINDKFENVKAVMVSSTPRTLTVTLTDPTESPVPGNYLQLVKVQRSESLVASGEPETDAVSLNKYSGICAVLSYDEATKVAVVTDPRPEVEPTNGEIELNKLSDAYAVQVALPVKLLEVEAGNSKVCKYDATTGDLTWETGASCALLLL